MAVGLARCRRVRADRRVPQSADDRAALTVSSVAAHGTDYGEVRRAVTGHVPRSVQAPWNHLGENALICRVEGGEARPDLPRSVRLILSMKHHRRSRSGAQKLLQLDCHAAQLFTRLQREVCRCPPAVVSPVGSVHRYGDVELDVPELVAGLDLQVRLQRGPLPWTWPPTPVMGQLSEEGSKFTPPGCAVAVHPLARGEPIVHQGHQQVIERGVVGLQTEPKVARD